MVFFCVLWKRGGCSLEISWSLLLLQIVQHFNKASFLPHQPLFYACVQQLAAESHFCSVTKLPMMGTNIGNCQKEGWESGLLRGKNAQNPRLKFPLRVLVLSSETFLKDKYVLFFSIQHMPKLLPSCSFPGYFIFSRRLQLSQSSAQEQNERSSMISP